MLSVGGASDPAIHQSFARAQRDSTRSRAARRWQANHAHCRQIPAVAYQGISPPAAELGSGSSDPARYSLNGAAEAPAGTAGKTVSNAAQHPYRICCS